MGHDGSPSRRAGGSPGRPPAARAVGAPPPPRPVGQQAACCRPAATPAGVRNPVWYALVTRAEHAEREAVDDVEKAVPAWRRRTRP